jgi:FKBP-type peptidyl-prolyl cis-trans isomerase FkpA
VQIRINKFPLFFDYHASYRNILLFVDLILDLFGFIMKSPYFLFMFFAFIGLAQAQTTTVDAGSASAAQTTAAAPAPLHITKLSIIDTFVGSGEEVINGSMVEVHYTGWIYNHKALNLHGAKFDSSRDAGNPLAVQVGARQVIRGWDQGLLGMKVGGKRTLLIPAYLAYSTQGSGSIPPNTHLVFDVELVAIKK